MSPFSGPAANWGWDASGFSDFVSLETISIQYIRHTDPALLRQPRSPDPERATSECAERWTLPSR